MRNSARWFRLDFCLSVLTVSALTGGGLAGVPAAHAQPEGGGVYAEEPTSGVYLPATPLAGDHDALSVSANPAGLSFLGGASFAYALDLEREEDATTAGRGMGFFLGQRLGGGFLPQIGLGLGLEFLRPPRVALSPDPGTPTRFTFGAALPLGSAAALGFSWHRFFDDQGFALAGVETYDLGASARLGSHFALGFVLRDLNAPVVADTPVQRRYELELVSRPTGSSAFELALGGRLGETRADVDGWMRWSARLARGVYLKGEVSARELHVLDRFPSGEAGSHDAHEYRLSAGLEFSLGSFGVATYGSGALDDDGDPRFLGGTFVARLSQEQVPSLLGEPQRIERLELGGDYDAQTHTATVARLRSIARDPAVQAVVVKLDGVDSGWATVEELRNELIRVRNAGKKVFAYIVAGSTREYFLATAADKIYVDPAGGIRLTGLSGTTFYFKRAFDAFGINPEFEKIQEYKSAPETFTREGPSEPALRMRNELLDSLYGSLVSAIAKSRGLEPRRVRQLIDEGPYSAGDLEKNTTLVDAVATPEQISDLVARELGGNYPVGRAPLTRPERWSYPAIAVVHIDGEIADGKSATIPFLGRKLAGSETIAGAIAAARADPRVAAVVLRIDSPGGSALASEVMAREVFATRGKKPIICSMGDVAASGGYFAAAGCDVIFADPMTITGSIGIFYGKFDTSKSLTRFGLTWRTFKRGKHADMEGMFRPFTNEERDIVKRRLRYFYGRFTKFVADGRGMTVDQVDAVGRGRVWSGADARTRGLVDRFGGIGDAIAFAKARVGFGERDRVRLVMLPAQPRGLIGQLLRLVGASKERDAAKPDLAWLPGGRALLEAIPASLLVDPTAAQARLPFTVVWE